MTDGIIKGTGNSRYLKTVQDALALYPTYGDFMQALVAGTLPVDLNGINAAGWTTVGTPLNKANLLSDDTVKAVVGIADNPTVDYALRAIGTFANAANQHLWAKQAGDGAWSIEVTDSADSYAGGGEDDTAYVYRGTLANLFCVVPLLRYGSYVGTDVCGSDNPNTITFDFVPTFVLITDDRYNGKCFILNLNGAAQYARYEYSTTSYGYQRLTWDGTTLSWYCQSYGDRSSTYSGATTWAQMNRTDTTYYYLYF